MANIGSLTVSLAARTEKFQQGLEKSGESVKKFADETEKSQDKIHKGLDKGTSSMASFAKGLAAVGLAAVAAFKVLASQVSNAANEVDSLAKQGRALGITYQEMRRLSIIAKMSGIEVQALSTGMRTLSNHILNGQRGLAESVDLFDRLGMNVSDLKGMSMPEIMERVAKSISRIKDPAEKLALSARLLGDQGAAIVASSKGLADAAAAADRINDTLGEEHVMAIEKANDAWIELGETMNSQFNKLAAKSSEFKNNLYEGLAVATRFWGNVLIGDLESLEDRITRLSEESKQFREGLIETEDKIRALEFKKAEANARQTGTPAYIEAEIQGLKKLEMSTRLAISERQSEMEKLIEISNQITGNDEVVEAGKATADAFVEAMKQRIEQQSESQSFVDFMRSNVSDSIAAEMDAVAAKIKDVEGKASDVSSQVRQRMSAGVMSKSSGFDIRGLLIGGGLGSAEQRQLEELEEQSGILQKIYRRLGNQVAMVGA